MTFVEMGILKATGSQNFCTGSRPGASAGSPVTDMEPLSILASSSLNLSHQGSAEDTEEGKPGMGSTDSSRWYSWGTGWGCPSCVRTNLNRERLACQELPPFSL